MTVTPGDLVRHVTPTVTIGGQSYEASRVRIQCEIATPLPHNVTGGGGVTMGEATADLADPTGPVLGRRSSPWNPASSWPPAPAVPASVDIDANGDTARRFTGRVFDAGGSATSPTVSVGLQDAAHRFSPIEITHPPLHRAMPGLNNGDPPRYVGLAADYMADYIMRAAGFRTTPTPAGLAMVNAPMQGSMVAALGAITSCSNIAGSGQPSWSPSPWGWAVSDVSATYTRLDAGNQTLSGRGIAVGMMVDPAITAGARVDFTLGSVTETVRVEPASSGRRVVVVHAGSTIGSPVIPGNWLRVEATWYASGTIVIRTDDGQSQTLNWSPGSTVLNGAFGQADLTVNDGSGAGGLVVQFVPSSYSGTYVTQELNAQMHTGSLLGTMQALPAIEGRNALDLLNEISTSTVCSIWIDRHGVLQWWHPDRIREQAPVAELTSTADLLNVAWRDGTDAARSRVTSSYRYGTTRIRSTPSITVWEGSGGVLEQGESDDVIISTPGDEDWLMIDGLGQAMLATPDPSNPDAIPNFNRGRGSWVGGSPMNADGETPGTLARREAEGQIGPGWRNNTTYPSVSRSLQQVGVRTWAITVGWTDISNNYWIALDQKLDLPSELNSRINGGWNGQRLPVLRARGRTWWETREYTSTITGPPRFDVLNHDIGPWIRPADGVARLTDWLAEQVTVPQPVLESLPVAYRSDLDLGQVVDVVEDKVYGTRFRILITGIDEDYAPGSASMSISGRVIAASSPSWTYADLAAMGLTYADLPNEFPTYADLAAGPQE